MDLSLCIPVLVPRDYFVGDRFPAPHTLLRHEELALTWVVLTEGQSMLYVTKEQAREWESRGIDWQARAMENLLESDEIITHEKRDENGRLIFVAMMHADGLGSSRLLLHTYLADLFPQGYQLALPERSVGLVFRSDLSASESLQVHAIIQDCYDNGITPMVNGVLSPTDLETV